MALRDAIQPGYQMVWNAALKNVEAMPELEFTPPGLETRSFRAIAVHMANASATFGDNIGRSTWERVIAFPPEAPMSKDQLLDAMRQGSERFLSGLRRLTDEEAAKIAQMPWGMQMPQGAAVAGNVPHMSYHNGQLTIYLRMQGVKPVFLAR